MEEYVTHASFLIGKKRANGRIFFLSKRVTEQGYERAKQIKARY
jgi:hypothetical protein